MKNVTRVKNSLASHYLTILRDTHSDTRLFREAADRLTSILLPEALFDVPLEAKNIQTPLGGFEGKTISGDIVFIPILRAGLSMLSQAQFLIPSARVGMIGLQRDERTAIASEYYKSIPDMTGAHVVILDPMLATGGSSLHVLRAVAGKEYSSIRLVTVVSVPEGLEAVHSEFPDLPIYTTAIDEGLDDRKFIVPGLGDFGDRYFGTD